jgi:hypothetical protein
MVAAIESAPEGFLATRKLREVVADMAGKDLQKTAMEYLEVEEPRRVKVTEEKVNTGKGYQRAKT